MNYKYGDLENLVLNAVWTMEEQAQESISVCEVQERINFLNNKNWAYTTIKTVMDRLVEKALIIRFKNGKKYYYKSVMSRQEMASDAMKKMTRQFFNNDFNEMRKMAEALCEQELAAI